MGRFGEVALLSPERAAKMTEAVASGPAGMLEAVPFDKMIDVGTGAGERDERAPPSSGALEGRAPLGTELRAPAWVKTAGTGGLHAQPVAFALLATELRRPSCGKTEDVGTGAEGSEESAPPSA